MVKKKKIKKLFFSVFILINKNVIIIICLRHQCRDIHVVDNYLTEKVVP